MTYITYIIVIIIIVDSYVLPGVPNLSRIFTKWRKAVLCEVRSQTLIKNK